LEQKTLAGLKIGERAVIVGFTDEILSLKLLEMGVLPGTEVVVSQIAPLGDPIAIKLADYLLALRKDEAETILII
jgi:ferrous iron transport protein A